ncbi:hypothetical protein N7504_006766 [Penicillium tannophilum]|nr:hypothetical protein N7504_006766 [Penicillium tannophilum]
MGALFSLPIISLLLVPTMTSYATSLNFIFFYMTWSTLVLSHSPLRVELVSSAAGEAGLPSGRKKRNVRTRELKVVAWSLFNVLLGTILQAAVETLLVQGLAIRSAVKVSMRLPMPWEMGKGLILGLLIREVLTYYVHRYVLHNSKSVFTRYMTRAHQSWYHSLRTPFPLTAHYDHPLVYLLVRFLPTYLPALLLRLHMLTYVLFLSIVSLEETFAYSGYTVMPTSFFLGGMARRTDEHLLEDGEGNFGPWGIMDWVFGTSIGDSIGDDALSELDEHEVEKQVRKAMEASKRKIREGTLRRNTRPRS